MVRNQINTPTELLGKVKPSTLDYWQREKDLDKKKEFFIIFEG